MSSSGRLTRTGPARVVSYDPFSLYGIHKEDLYHSRGDINRRSNMNIQPRLIQYRINLLLFDIQLYWQGTKVKYTPN
jgi:hypothetical protein